MLHLHVICYISTLYVTSLPRNSTTAPRFSVFQVSRLHLLPNSFSPNTIVSDHNITCHPGLYNAYQNITGRFSLYQNSARRRHKSNSSIWPIQSPSHYIKYTSVARASQPSILVSSWPVLKKLRRPATDANFVRWLPDEGCNYFETWDQDTLSVS